MGRLALILLLFLIGCETERFEMVQTDNVQDKILVSITDGNNVKIYSEALPLIYVMNFRDINTNQTGSYIFNYQLPANWQLLFESETISFNVIGTDSIPLNWLPNTHYEFAITTK